MLDAIQVLQNAHSICRARRLCICFPLPPPMLAGNHQLLMAPHPPRLDDRFGDRIKTDKSALHINSVLY